MNFQMNNLMKQAQEMQKKMQEMQAEIGQLKVIGKAGGNTEVTMNGHGQILDIQMEDSFWEESHEVCRDLLIAAFNNAKQNLDETSKQKLSSLTAGMTLPKEFDNIGKV